MPSIQNVIFEEPFFGYRMKADGSHYGSTNPIRDSDKLQLWIRDWVETQYELRVTDAGDSIVMQIVQGHMIFPPDPDGLGVLVWDKEEKDWALEAPLQALALSPEIENLLAAMRSSKNSSDRFMHCIQCKNAFTDKNVHSTAGWRETQISGYCEDCFDSIFAGDDGAESDMPV